MTHGWNSNVGVWADPLGFAILHQLFANGTSQDWDIVGYDWRNQTATRLPGEAANRGRTIGESLGQDILNAGYARVHLLGHSAGSWLIDGAADVITRNPRNTPGSAMKTIHATFLDVYVPDPATVRIGDNSTFSDHYVDNREVYPSRGEHFPNQPHASPRF